MIFEVNMRGSVAARVYEVQTGTIAYNQIDLANHIGTVAK
jgi:hypothetical protein